MDCRILRHVTLKSDGHLGCDDSVGYGINLGHVSLSSGWRLRDVLTGPIYSYVRSSFKEGRVPWPGTCEGCDLFSAGGRPDDTLDTRLELLVEPTLGCNISCACCLRKQIISKGRDTSGLDPAILKRFVDACRTEKITIDQIHYIGWGEPLLHGAWRALFDIAKAAAPSAVQVVTTAGNVDFRSTIGDAPLDRLVVSCDGSEQRSYEKYRRGGNLDTVVQFMTDAKRHGSPEMFLEWKYILFEHNDSDEDLLRAQIIADAVGVDSLLFIITNSKWHSERFTVDTPDLLPIRSLVASISPAAAMCSVVAACRALPPAEAREGRGYIDRATISVGRFLTVEGWCLDAAGGYVDSVALLIDGQIRAKTRPILKRVDVAQAIPSAVGHRCGFMFRLPIDPSQPPRTLEIACLGASGRFLMGGPAVWDYPDNSIKRRADLPVVRAEPATA